MTSIYQITLMTSATKSKIIFCSLRCSFTVTRSYIILPKLLSYKLDGSSHLIHVNWTANRETKSYKH